MKTRLFLSILMSLIAFTASSNRFWALDIPGYDKINTLLIDSITYRQSYGQFIETIWTEGNPVSNRYLSYGDRLQFSEDNLKCCYATAEEDGVDALIINNEVFAMLTKPESGGYVYSEGSIYNPEVDRILFDGNGLIRALEFEGWGKIGVIYTADELVLFDEKAENVYEIPYSEIEKNMVTVSDKFSKNPITRILQFRNIIKKLIDKPLKKSSMRILLSALSEDAEKCGSILGDFTDYYANSYEIDGWISTFDRFHYPLFFGDMSVSTLPAEKLSVAEFNLPCDVYASSRPIPFLSIPGIEENYTYRIEMHLNPLSSEPFEPNQYQNVDFEKEGRYDFRFTLGRLDALYEYTPYISLFASARIRTDTKAFSIISIPTFDMPELYTYDMQYYLAGELSYFTTDAVYSSVNDIPETSSNDALVICSFSECPDEAVCQVSVSTGESMPATYYEAKPGVENQSIRISGLRPFTEYMVSTRILYQGIEYHGNTAYTFTTSGPSGSVLSVDRESIDMTSATVVCRFEDVDASVECGIIVEGEDGSSQTISAASIDMEQRISIAGLEPGTTYTCYAYVSIPSNDYYNRQQDGVSFTTLIPNIAGTWNVVETYQTRPFPGAEWETKTKEYTLTLKEDGSIHVAGLDYEYIGGGWNYSRGNFGATCHITASQTQNTWDRYSGKVNDIRYPTKITGVRYRGNMNQVVNVEDVAGTIEMSR